MVVLGGGEDVTAFLLEPTRSGTVPREFFPKGTRGILNVDRYPGYFALLGPDWKLLLEYCWAQYGIPEICCANSSRARLRCGGGNLAGNIIPGFSK